MTSNGKTPQPTTGDWVVVPREPTDKQRQEIKSWLQFAGGSHDSPTINNIYRAMLAAAPHPTTNGAILGVEELRELSERATGGPWCWEQCGEKCDAPVIGIAYRDDDTDCKNPLSGYLEGYDGDGNEVTYYRETIAYEVQDCDGASASANAAFIVAAVNFIRSNLTPTTKG